MPGGPPCSGALTGNAPAAPSALHPVPGDSEDPDLTLPEAGRDFPAFSGSSQELGTGDIPRGALRACEWVGLALSRSDCAEPQQI